MSPLESYTPIEVDSFGKIVDNDRPISKDDFLNDEFETKNIKLDEKARSATIKLFKQLKKQIKDKVYKSQSER